jgi:Cu/Ag efflux protein CusF
MTMVFRADEEIMAKLAEGKEVEFLADRVNGKLTVTALK